LKKLDYLLGSKDIRKANNHFQAETR